MAKQKLTQALERFCSAMKDRMKQKQRAGFTGWDGPGFSVCNVPRRMHDKSLNVLLQGDECEPKDLVDIANMAMMLHHRVTSKK
jgi:hypothetical protein